MIYYTTTHQHPDLVLHLRERKYLYLQQMFSDANKVEDNLQDYGKLRDQILNEESDAQKPKKDY